MLTQFTDWLWHLIVSIFSALWDFIQDAFVALLGAVVDAVVTLVSSIPVPDWLSGGLGSSWGGLSDAILFYVTQAGMPAALLIIGGGYVFRILRKIFTLAQW